MLGSMNPPFGGEGRSIDNINCLANFESSEDAYGPNFDHLENGSRGTTWTMILRSKIRLTRITQEEINWMLEMVLSHFEFRNGQKDTTNTVQSGCSALIYMIIAEAIIGKTYQWTTNAQRWVARRCPMPDSPRGHEVGQQLTKIRNLFQVKVTGDYKTGGVNTSGVKNVSMCINALLKAVQGKCIDLLTLHIPPSSIPTKRTKFVLLKKNKELY